MLWTNIPVSTQKLPVDPYISFKERSEVEIGVTCAGQDKIAYEQFRESNFIVFEMPIDDISVVEMDAICLPFEGCSISGLEMDKTLSVNSLHLAVIDVSHSFN